MKKVIINKESSNVFVEDCQPSNIYAFLLDGEIYKAQKMPNEKQWLFVSMGKSWGAWNGIRSSLFELLNSSGFEDIYEFENSKEFLEWALEVTK